MSLSNPQLSNTQLSNPQLFKDNYTESRQQFLAEAKNAGAIVEHYYHPSLNTVSGDKLITDTAFIGNKDATHVMVVLSGTHGLEGATGSALQTSFLKSLSAGKTELPEFAALLFVHAVNPYGFEHHTRVNEDNIDLNRNFIAHQSRQSTNNAAKEAANEESSADYQLQQAVQALITPEYLGIRYSFYFYLKLLALIAKYGIKQLTNALISGQYSFPNGLNFGGHSAAWSNITCRAIIKKHTLSAKKVVFIDWHTGLGDYGKPCYLCFNEHHSTAYKQASTWWGKAALNDPSNFSSKDNRPDYSGLLVQGLAQELPPNAESVQTVIEFGTYKNMTMLRALITDRWLRYVASKPLSAKNEKLQQWLISRFYPADDSWKESVLSSGLEIQQKTLNGLLLWHAEQKE